VPTPALLQLVVRGLVAYWGRRRVSLQAYRGGRMNGRDRESTGEKDSIWIRGKMGISCAQENEIFNKNREIEKKNRNSSF